MFRTAIAAAAVVSLVAVAPASAASLGGAPELTWVDAHHAKLRFVVQDPEHPLDAKIAFAGGQRVSAVAPTGKRHGDDPIYAAKVTNKGSWRKGTKYTVRFTFAGGETTSVKLKLH